MPILKIGLVLGAVGVGLLAPSSPARAACDGCVVAAVNAHKAEMVWQFAELKKFLGEQFKMRIPHQTGHGFHGKLDTHSMPNWTGIPRQPGHLR